MSGLNPHGSELSDHLLRNGAICGRGFDICVAARCEACGSYDQHFNLGQLPHASIQIRISGLRYVVMRGWSCVNLLVVPYIVAQVYLALLILASPWLPYAHTTSQPTMSVLIARITLPANRALLILILDTTSFALAIILKYLVNLF